MFRTRMLALAAASALIVSGCATTAWQRPPNHPADPDAAAGVTPAISSLDRYRSGTPQASMASPKAGKEDPPASDATDHAGGHQQRESQP